MKDFKNSYLKIGVILLLVVLSIIYNLSKKSDLDDNSAFAVAKVYKISKSKYVSKSALYEFYYDGKRYEGSKQLKPFNDVKPLNRFYEIKFSKENPENNEINFELEVKDFEQIKRANFNVD